jgi:primary-amine oxidase
VTVEQLTRSIVNKVLRVSGPVGYTLIPGENALPYAAPDSWLLRRAGFLNAHLWVTPYEARERYAAGDYPNQSHGGDGLPRWTKGNRAVENQDIVLWYTLGVTHIPRPEEWPSCPCIKRDSVGADRFFSRNPRWMCKSKPGLKPAPTSGGISHPAFGAQTW